MSFFEPIPAQRIHFIERPLPAEEHFSGIPRIAQEWRDLTNGGRQRFQFVMIDPPWDFGSWSKRGRTARAVQSKYKTASIDWIKALPVDLLLARDSIVWIWITNPNLHRYGEILDAWGLRACTAGHWRKTTVTGKTAFGGGYWLRGGGEPFGIAMKGRPTVKDRGVSGMIEDLRREHSRKPDAAYIAAERMWPGEEVRRIDVFSREARPGWVNWGDQADFFNT